MGLYFGSWHLLLQVSHLRPLEGFLVETGDAWLGDGSDAAETPWLKDFEAFQILRALGPFGKIVYDPGTH